MHADLIKYGRMLFEQGLNNSHSGNLSTRKGNALFITRHGARLGDLTAKDVVKANVADNKKDAEASFEIKVHRAIYQECPRILAIAHAHTLHATALSLFPGSFVTPLDAEGLHYLPHIPILRCKSTIGSDEVSRRLPALINRYHAAIVAGHGVFAGSTTLEEASMYAAVVESVSSIIYLHKTLK